MVCNKTTHDAKVALGRFDGFAWTSRGWWTLAAGRCTILLTKPLDARYYYLYAADDTSADPPSVAEPGRDGSLNIVSLRGASHD